MNEFIAHFFRTVYFFDLNQIHKVKRQFWFISKVNKISVVEIWYKCREIWEVIQKANVGGKFFLDLEVSKEVPMEVSMSLLSS